MTQYPKKAPEGGLTISEGTAHPGGTAMGQHREAAGHCVGSQETDTDAGVSACATLRALSPILLCFLSSNLSTVSCRGRSPHATPRVETETYSHDISVLF